MSDDSWMAYAWRCNDCGQGEKVDSSHDAEIQARDHRDVTGHAYIVTIDPSGETPA